MPDRFDALQFQQPFRKYQTLILDLVQSKWDSDRKFHLVAPPGAGKTIVGIELICRFGQPAVVFAPTATIQAQWQEKVGLFLKDPSQRDQWVGTDSGDLHPINIFTYQLISTPGENLDFLRELAEVDWLETLVSEGKANNEAAARVRLNTIRGNNPAAYDNEIRKRYARRKREALRDAQFDSTSLLHANARDLIDRLARYGVRTIVLDECHHLLDYWAIVLKELIRRIGDPYIVGLTATLPDPDSDDEYENYTSLLGEVDFEVPTPAVVKEGSLAPYRDLVYFCEPTEREQEYLNDIQASFERTLHAITDSGRFSRWVAATLLYRTPELWLNYLNEKPLLATAGIKYLKLQKQPLPADLPLLDEMESPITLDDWANLLEPFGLDVLKTSNDPADHKLLADLEKALAPFGLSLTERGLRQGRAPGDLVLALSESKDAAAVRILQAEQKALGAQLRAVVITDYEKVSARARRLKDVLDPDAGSAVRLFRAVVADLELNSLDAILVTGTTVLLDSDHGEEMLTAMRKWLADRKLAATVDYEGTDEEKIMALTGAGRDWSSRTYVQLITAMFEQGFTRCLVGTRGIFGEGWDALGLNTLIDLTAVTTSTGVNQLRGRTIRLDPSWDRKVAHNWDVVCVARNFERGDSDLRRFNRKHDHYWGVAEAAPQPGAAAESEKVYGQIAKGPVHVDSDLAFDLATRSFTEINFEKYSRRMLARATPESRVTSYDLWGIGQPYSNETHTVTRLEASEIRLLTAHTVTQTLSGLGREFLATWAAIGLLVCFCLGGLALLPVWGGAVWLVLIPLWVIGVPLIAFSLRRAYSVYKASLAAMPPLPVLLDIGRAVLAGLREAGLVNRALTDDCVRVQPAAEDDYEVFVDPASPEASDMFARAYRHVLGPILEPRYLVTRDVSRLPDMLWQPVWAFVRLITRQRVPEIVYHPVPDMLAANKQRAEAFARQWEKYVGGGELIFTKNEAGRNILSKARTQRRPKVRQMAFEVWR
jgi:superfamily II DNA or RNA helicase